MTLPGPFLFDKDVTNTRRLCRFRSKVCNSALTRLHNFQVVSNHLFPFRLIFRRMLFLVFLVVLFLVTLLIAPLGPYSGANAFTFTPNYTTEEATDDQDGKWAGTCSIGHVREPYYQTLTPENNGAISGFALTSLSTEIHRFLFG